MVKIKAFVNGRVCLDGRFVDETIYVDEGTGLIIHKPDETPEDFVDLKGECFVQLLLSCKQTVLLVSTLQDLRMRQHTTKISTEYLAIT